MDNNVPFVSHDQLDGSDTLTDRTVEHTNGACTFVLGIHGELWRKMPIGRNSPAPARTALERARRSEVHRKQPRLAAAIIVTRPRNCPTFTAGILPRRDQVLLRVNALLGHKR